MQAPTQIPLRILEIHKTAVDNIRFSKGQQWLVTNFVTALSGVLFLIAVESETASRFLLVALATLVSLYGALMIVSFQSAIQRSRQRRDWIYQEYFLDDERQALGLLQPPSWSSTLEPFMSWTREPFIMMVAVIVAGWAVGLGFVISRLF
jgi:hypothetical protein